jgi:cytohesin
VRALIELGADINKANDDGATPLYIATEKGHEAVVRALIEADADVNKANDDDETPLFTAAEEGQ